MFPYFIFWEYQSMKDGELMENEEVKTTETTVDDNTNAQIPTDKPVMPVQDEVRLFGRHIIMNRSK